MYLRVIVVIFSMATMAGCSNNENAQLIQGNWMGAEWLVNGEASNRDIKSTKFSFEHDGQYSFEYNGSKETGTYKVENDMLFTTPSGQREMMVKIAKITADTLVFDMNRGGIPEVLTLLRSK